MIILRTLRSFRTGAPLFTFQKIAEAFGYPDRRNVNNYWREYESCGGNMLDFLIRKRKIDTAVVAAAGDVVEENPTASTSDICSEVNRRLNRSDLTPANIRTALEQVPYTRVRKKIIREWEVGNFHPKEEVVLEELMVAVAEDSADRKAKDWSPLLCSIDGASDDVPEEEGYEIVQENQREAAADVLDPNMPAEQIQSPVRMMIIALALFYWNVPLSRIGQWLGISKSTAYNWITGISVELWPLIDTAIRSRVKGARLYVDEKWLKIRGKWHYWFVAVDDETGIPVLNSLLPSRSRWACRWFMLKLKRYGICPDVIITDGLAGYVSAVSIVFANTRHLLCLFHHQQSVTRWVKKHLKGIGDAGEIKRKMKKVVQTADPRTVYRRLKRLQEESAEKGWDISEWIKKTRNNLPRLLPALRKNRYPRTTNPIERFFRAYQRFYKTRSGFHSAASAKLGLIVFLVGYLFTRQDKTGKAPIEELIPEARHTPLYQILNDPIKWGIAELGDAMSRKGGEADEMATDPLEEAA